jgi:hypothetical protein
VELADTSAWSNRHKSPDTTEEFARLILAQRIATCDPVKYELLWADRDHGSLVARRESLDHLPTIDIRPAEWKRAFDVLELLGARGPAHHRQVGLVDLLVAAAAERAGIPVLHYDRHFEAIASITGQPVRALAPLGSL